MGAVYEARHVLIGKRVAVKVLLEKFLTKSDFVARLLQEARLASSIGHENIVDVTDFGTTDDGRSFVVMEFLDGEALAQLIMREAPLPVERSLRIARQVASALGAAHAKGIYHRDVKPENVYLVRRGEADFVKVVDFGISKAVKQGGNEEGADAYRLTHTGLLLGTPLYMSPEQARGDEDLDHRVDVWATGRHDVRVPPRARCRSGANNYYLGIISQVLTHRGGAAVEGAPRARHPWTLSRRPSCAPWRRTARHATAPWRISSNDLERLLAGDQNVGAAPRQRRGPPGQRPVAPPRRWHLGLAAVLALAVGVSLALSRPPGGGAPTPPVGALPSSPKPVEKPSAAPDHAAAARTPSDRGAPGAKPVRSSAGRGSPLHSTPRNEHRAPLALTSPKGSAATSDSRATGACSRRARARPIRISDLDVVQVSSPCRRSCFGSWRRSVIYVR